MRAASAVVFALLLTAPLLTWPGTGFDGVRLAAVLGLTCALLAAAFVRAARGGDRPPGPVPLRTAGLLLLGAQVVSLLFARSVAEGVVPVLILFAGVSVYASVRSGVVDQDSIARLLPVIPAVGIAVAVLGLVQAMVGGIPMESLRPLFGGEAVSTEGNRNYSGALAAMLLPVTVGLARSGARWTRGLSGVASVLLAALLLASESRGGLVAAVVGLVVAGVAMKKARVRFGGLAVGLLLLAVVGIFGAFQLRSQISPGRMETVGFRTEVWKSGLRMAAARPILGWGVGNFAVEYPSFRSEAEFRSSHKYATDAFMELEDAHSTWVQTAAETGALGLLALLLVVYIAGRLWRYYLRNSPDADRAAILAGLGGGAAAYLVAGIFNSLTLKTSHTLFFWIFLALLERIGDLRPWRASSRSREGRVAVPAAAAFVAFFGAAWAGALGLAQASFESAMHTDQAAEREHQLRESLDRNPFAWRPHFELSLVLYALERFPGAVEEGRAALRLRPFHLEGLNHTALSLIRAGGDAQEIEALLRKATDLAPYYSKSWFNRGAFERQRGNPEEARRFFTRAIENNPDIGASYFWRGLLTYAGGEATMAIEDFRKARTRGFDVAGVLRSQRLSAENDVRLAEFFR